MTSMDMWIQDWYSDGIALLSDEKCLIWKQWNNENLGHWICNCIWILIAF